MGLSKNDERLIGIGEVSEYTLGERVQVAKRLAAFAGKAIGQKPAVKEALAAAFVGEPRNHGDLQHNGAIRIGFPNGYKIKLTNYPYPQNAARGYTRYSPVKVEITRFEGGNEAEKVIINPEWSGECEITHIADPFYVGASPYHGQPTLVTKNSEEAAWKVTQFLGKFIAADIPSVATLDPATQG